MQNFMMEELEWKDKDGNRVEFESESYGCKITSKITQSEIMLLGDEVGVNLDMTGGGHIG